MRKHKQNRGITEEVLLAEYGAVYRYALSICRNEAEASDLTQETFLKAMQNVKEFQENSSLYTWLCTILKHLWINKCKKYSRELSTEDEDWDFPDQSKSIEQMVEDRDMAKQVHAILHTMEEPYKEVFSLRIFGELPFKDIAELFDKTESWARVTYHRAKKMMIERLRTEGFYE